MRFCGSFRFSLYGAWRWICLRDVYASLYYLPEDKEIPISDIPSLHEPLDEKLFVREDGNYKFNADQFYYFVAHNVAYLGETINSAPKAQLTDGLCDIVKMKSTATRCNLLKILFDQDTGNYFDKNDQIKPHSGYEYVKTKCFRLIPKSSRDDDESISEAKNIPRYYAVDGERFPIEPIQIKVMNKVLRVYCLN